MTTCNCNNSWLGVHWRSPPSIEVVYCETDHVILTWWTVGNVTLHVTTSYRSLIVLFASSSNSRLILSKGLNRLSIKLSSPNIRTSSFFVATYDFSNSLTKIESASNPLSLYFRRQFHWWSMLWNFQDGAMILFCKSSLNVGTSTWCFLQFDETTTRRIAKNIRPSITDIFIILLTAVIRVGKTTCWVQAGLKPYLLEISLDDLCFFISLKSRVTLEVLIMSFL